MIICSESENRSSRIWEMKIRAARVQTKKGDAVAKKVLF